MFEILVFFVCSVIVGVLFTFFGYPFFRILLPIWGFFAGLAFGVNGMEAIFGSNLVSATTGFVFGLFIGIGLAVVAYFLYSLVIYWFSITVGYVLGAGLMMAIGSTNNFFNALVGIIFAVALCFLFMAAKMPKFFIVLLTAAGGAMAVIMGIFVLFGQVPEVAASLQLTELIVSGSWFWMFIWLVLAAVGIAFQSVLIQASEDLSDPYEWDTTAPKAKTKKKRKK